MVKVNRVAMRVLFLTTLLFGVASCDKSDQQAQEKNAIDKSDQQVQGGKAIPWHVAEKFEVGDNVFVRSLALESAKNSLWVGTSVGVLNINLSSKNVQQTFTRKDGLANEYVFAIGIDHEGYKWFGTNGGGASRYKDGEWKTYFPMHGLADYWIYAFDSQKDGTLWIGTWAGANRFNLKTKKFDTYVDELINIWVYGLGVDSDDRVWFGTEGGVSMFDGKKWSSWTHKDGLGAENISGLEPSTNTGLGTRKRHDLNINRAGKETYNPNYVFSIHIDHEDTVWAGTWGGGAAYFNGKQWKNYTTVDGLAGDIVYSIVQDKTGAYWFGTNHGLSRFDGKHWQTISQQHGLLGNNVYTLIVADNGDIWAGTRGGVTHLSNKHPVANKHPVINKHPGVK